MAKTDVIDSEQDSIFETEVSYKSGMSSDFFEKISKNINYLCSLLEGMKCEVLPFGTTSWTAPANVKSVFAIGFGGGGGGGGAAPFSLGGGLNNSTLYVAGNGVGGGISTFNGVNVGAAGAGGQGFRFRANSDSGGLAQGENSAFPNIGFRNTDLYRVKGLAQPSGGAGGHLGFLFTLNGVSYYNGGGAGGSAGTIGFQSFTGLTGGGVYPVVIGGGGAAGANHPFTATWASNTGRTLTNAQAGANSPGMIVISVGF